MVSLQRAEEIKTEKKMDLYSHQQRQPISQEILNRSK